MLSGTALTPPFSQAVLEVRHEARKRRPQRFGDFAQLHNVEPPLPCLVLTDVGLWTPEPLGQGRLRESGDFASLAQQRAENLLLERMNRPRHGGRSPRLR